MGHVGIHMVVRVCLQTAQRHDSSCTWDGAPGCIPNKRQGEISKKSCLRFCGRVSMVSEPCHFVIIAVPLWEQPPAHLVGFKVSPCDRTQCNRRAAKCTQIRNAHVDSGELSEATVRLGGQGNLTRVPKKETR